MTAMRNDTPAPRKGALGPEDSAKLVLSTWHAFWRGEIEAGLQNFAEDATWFVPGSMPASGLKRGREEIGRFRHGNLDIFTELKREVVDWSPLADEEMLRAEMRQALVRALKEMPLLYRAPVILRDVQGLTTEEASAVLHVKEQTLKSRLHRGRLMLREQLTDFAGGLSLH